MITAFDPLCLTGKSRRHLQPLDNHHALQPQACTAFIALQQAAKQQGFNLQAASSFRDFSRQQAIWNAKFSGQRRVHDDQGQTVNVLTLDELARCHAILRWSALPGASRHHWGTEIDIYDPDRLPIGQHLQLEPWEYQDGGYFSDLTLWLHDVLPQFDFALPFTRDQGGIAIEPWHISYLPLAEKLAQQLTPQSLINAWEQEDIAGKTTLITHLDTLFERYIR